MRTNNQPPLEIPSSHFVCFTDGSAIPNPGNGGWGSLICRPCGCRYEVSGFAKDTTNNRMEITAVIESLKSIPKGSFITVVTDSTYVSNLYGLKKIQKGQIVEKNADLWNDLVSEIQRHSFVDFKWVKGHSGLNGNERADRLANEARIIGTLDDEPF